MSARTTLPVASTAPDPNRDQPIAPADHAPADHAPARAAPSRVGRLLGLVRKLVAYGTDLLTTLQQGSSAHTRAMAMLDFGTRDIALIIARIKCGLMRAAALEDRLNVYVERGRDLPPAPLDWPAPRARTEVRGDASDSDAPPAARSQVLALLPTAEEIAEQVRTRSLGAVLRDICRDLCITGPAVGTLLWDELEEVAEACGFDLTGLVRNGATPVFGADFDDRLALELEVERVLTPGWQVPAGERETLEGAAAGRPP